jgi:hypothetical protein
MHHMSPLSKWGKNTHNAERVESVMAVDPRGERLQIMLTREELTVVDSWRFSRHMPSRAAAVRELLRRGLSAEGFSIADGATKSGDYSVLAESGD